MATSLEESLQVYAADTKVDLAAKLQRKNSLPGSLQELKSEIARLDRDYHISHNEKTWNNVARILKPFEAAGSILGAAASLSPFAPASLILGATLHLMKTTRRVIEAYNSLGDFLGWIAGVVDRMEVHGPTTEPKLQAILKRTLGAVIEVLGLATRLVDEKRGRKRAVAKEFIAILTGEDPQIQGKMAVLQRLAEEEAAMCLALIHQGGKRVESKVDKISDVNDQDRFNSMLGLKTWTEMQNYHDDLVDKRGKGVEPAWVAQDPIVQKWKTQGHDQALIWVYGDPYCGKSFIASKLISEMRKEQKSTVAYFYVRGHGTTGNLATVMFKCIALQLAQKSQAFRKIATKALKDLSSVRNMDKIWKNFFVPFLKLKRVWRTFLVIDGLDAAPPTEQEKILSRLKALKEENFEGKPLFRVAVISRPDLLPMANDIWTTDVRLHVSSDRTQSDIAQYLRNKYKAGKLTPLNPARGLTEEERESRIEKLTRESQGMFLWVSLIVTRAEEVTDVEEKIKTLNHGCIDHGSSPDIMCHIRDTLEKVQQRVSDELNWQAILRWVACAYRELTVGELLFLRKAALHRDRISNPDNSSTKSLQQELGDLLTFDSPSGSSPNLSLSVQFQHRCFKDYLLRDDSKLLSASDSTYPFRRSDAHAVVAEICFRRLLEDDEPAQGPQDIDILRYAADHVIDHVRAVEKDIVPRPENRSLLATRLQKLLEDSNGIQRWYDAMSEEKRMDLLSSLLDDDEVYQRINYWQPNTCASAQDLYATFAHFCAEGWLQGKDVDTEFCILFLHRYNALNGNEEQQTSETMPNKISDVKSMSILNLAREAKFICDSDWHVRVARALRESNHLEEAEDEYNQAEENDANSWIIKTELALTLAARGNLREAVEKAKEALTRDPPPDTLSQSKIYLDLSVWQLARGRKSEAIEAAKNAYTREPGSLLKTAHYFQTLGRAGKYRLLIELCQELNRSDSTPTPLVQLLLGWEEGHDLFGEAAWNMNEMPFARKILEETVEAAEREGDFEGAAFEEDQRALYYLRHEQADRRPRLIWEKLHSRIPDIQTREYIEQLQCRSLCNDYYRKAVEAKSSKDQAAWVDKLEDLAKVSWRANTAAATPEHRGDAALMLSRWRRLYGNEKQTDKEKSLKELCRSKVCQGVRILEDDDPLNDADGYVILARALLSAGEEEEASQVFAAAMLPLLRRSQSLGKGDTRSSNALEAMQRAPLSPFPCHGKYGCKEDDWLALYVCRVCLDASFCISCLVKQANSRVCDKSHDMIQVYLKGRDLNSMQKPMAAFKEGQLEPDKEWLKELKQRWQITDDTIAATSLPTPEIVRKSQIKLKLFY